MIGGVYHEQDRLDEAAATLRRGLELAERIGSVEEIGGCLINLGLAELERGAIAEHRLRQPGVEEFERVGHGSGRAIAYSNLAWALTAKGEYERRSPTPEHAHELARSSATR